MARVGVDLLFHGRANYDFRVVSAGKPSLVVRV